ncbi:MAG: hypothetical protein RAK21_08595 [Synechococcus sp. SP2 MAG]|nr:hypothetical protein [Synechococcus sp. SP2 MAG]
MNQQPAAFWSLKPWWCQPWSIVLTGVVISLSSWLFLHRLWITLPITLAILVWWMLFLVLVPAAYRKQEIS